MAQRLDLSDIVRPIVRLSLDPPLDYLTEGSAIFFSRTNDAMPFNIVLNHPQAPHKPEVTVDWITKDGQYMLFHAYFSEPTDQLASVIVRLKAPDMVETISLDEFDSAKTQIASEISEAVKIGSAEYNSQLRDRMQKHIRTT